MNDIGQKKDQTGIDELISLRQASRLCGLSTNHLRLLAGKGLLWGKKVDNFWVTTEKAIRDYQSLGKKPGPTPKNH